MTRMRELKKKWMQNSEFRKEYEAQLVRWDVARANLDLKAETVRRALALLDGPRATKISPAPSLSSAQKEEIARLLAESESSPIEDTLGIKTPWDQRQRK